jgi:hypothetical protein
MGNGNGQLFDSALIFPYNDLSPMEDREWRMENGEMNDLDKIRVLLPHWIEHNAEHAAEFREWADRVQQAGKDSAAQGITFAANALETANDALQVAFKQLGGPLE